MHDSKIINQNDNKLHASSMRGYLVVVELCSSIQKIKQLLNSILYE